MPDKSRNQTALATSTRLDPRWAAVLERDLSADGRFFYSVKTTGVYCRPSCGARTARPENVAFHESTAGARIAGFRACKRCKPDDAPLAERQAALIAELCRRIERSERAPSLDELAAHAAMSVFHLHRVFKAVTGVTPRAYAVATRKARVRAQLEQQASVTEAIYGAGFSSSGRFYEASTQLLGMTPGEFRSGGAHVAIRFAIGQCSLGAILVAASTRGVCTIALGDDPDALALELAQQFPRAQLIGADAEFEQLVARVVSLMEQPQLRVELPLDVRGTAFQQRVWQALQAIPVGSTASYTEIAERIGAPRAVRAVAHACASNTLAVVIPCHRVVRIDGGLAGYRWGVERKRSLLAREREECAVR